ncbi:MAG: collagen-like triple helix repeat-containing protein [Gemmataceae bacterium]|nr:collagen-like triple helix repeat-containing protein [Gemmataceae bacterium]
MTTYTRWLTGLDLGQAADFSALVAVEQSAPRAAHAQPRPVSSYAVRYIERFPLGTGYPAIVARVRELFAAPPLAGTDLLADRTGVGAPVFDLLRESGIRATVAGWSITAGRVPGVGTVPKVDLVGAVQAALGNHRLKIAPELQLAEVLAKEMETFRTKVTADRNETFAAWRERDHDDILLALALALWWGERLGPPGPAAVPRVIADHGARTFAGWTGRFPDRARPPPAGHRCTTGLLPRSRVPPLTFPGASPMALHPDAPLFKQVGPDTYVRFDPASGTYAFVPAERVPPLAPLPERLQLSFAAGRRLAEAAEDAEVDDDGGEGSEPPAPTRPPAEIDEDTEREVLEIIFDDSIDDAERERQLGPIDYDELEQLLGPIPADDE